MRKIKRSNRFQNEWIETVTLCQGGQSFTTIFHLEFHLPLSAVVDSLLYPNRLHFISFQCQDPPRNKSPVRSILAAVASNTKDK